MTRAIGVDAGGSKTLALLVDENGNVLTRARASGANPYTVGTERSLASLREVLLPLLSLGPVSVVCLGAAGLARDADTAFFEDTLRAIVAAQVKIVLRHDGAIALRAAGSARPAMVVIAGTGSLVYGERADGTQVRCGGYGTLLEDLCGGYSIGLAALRHCARVLDRLEPPGPLSAAISEAVNASSVPELVSRVHAWPPDVGAIAALVEIVADVRGQDPSAQRIISRARDELKAQVQLVAGAIHGGQTLPVAVSGGAFDALPCLQEAVCEAAGTMGGCEVTRPALEAAHGAALLALESVKA